MPVLALAAASLVGCTQIQPGWQGVNVDSIGAPSITGCAKEETQEITILDSVYEYPARDISWDATADQNANPERPPYTVLSNAKDQAYMQVPVYLVFDLTTDCDKLQQFHRDLGTKYEAWKDGKDGGWIQLLDFVIGQPLEQTLLSISQKYTYQQIWNDEKVREEYRAAIQAALPEAAKQKAGQEYFTDFTVTIGQPYPQDQRLIDLRANEQSALSEARTNEIKLTADANAREKAAQAELAAANAEVAAKEAEARKRAAEIAAFGQGPGAIDAYLREQCQRTSGCKQYDPAPVVVGAGGVVNP